MRHSLHELKNGTRVILVPHQDTAAATVLALYEVGSRYESASLAGVSHYIEHMLFKGTSRRPNNAVISRELDGVGADYNAFTGKDMTGYWIHLQSAHLPLAIDMLDDMISHSVFRPKDLDSERKVIFEEIRMYDDNPMMVVDERMEEELYRGSTLGRVISGTVESLTGVSRSALTAYHAKHYVPEKTVLAVAGKFDDVVVLAQLEKTFGKVRRRKAAPSFEKFSVAKAGYRAPRIRLEYKETEQAQIAMGWPAYASTDPRLAASRLMTTILGGTMSSRLFTEVREKRGLAYGVRASGSPYQDVGNVTVSAGIAKDRMAEAMRVIVREIAKIAATRVTAEELDRAKEYYKGKLILGLEGSSQLAEWYAKQALLNGRLETPDERIAAAMAVTRDDIRAVAEDVFRKNRTALAVIGPFKDESLFAKPLETLN